jgi:hypothetical protein
MFDTKKIVGCVFCGGANVVEFNVADYNAWKAGAYIQDALGYLSADDRELLMSGICPTCWNDTFSDDE